MKILVVGSGGREHAIIKKIKESGECHEIFAAPGNGGISTDAVCVPIAATDLSGMVEFAIMNQIEFVVVAPDDPLVLGMVDALTQAGIRSFGPDKAAAVIEGSKAFAKDLMKRYGIPTAGYEVFEIYEEAAAAIQNNKTYPLVIKADGLALGKGVVIAQNQEEALAAVHGMMCEGKFGESGRHIVIEEFLSGVEISVLTLTDGDVILPLTSSMDHKRAHDDDQGPNTGGMGTIAPHPLFTQEIAKRCMEEIFQPTVQAMKAMGRPFRGCLYFGLMITEDGPKVIEYNCRFGDPETQVVLPLLDGNLLELMEAVTNGTLAEVKAGIKPGSAACVVMASGGYPLQYENGFEIKGLNTNGQRDGVTIYHAGTIKKGDRFFTAGGRVLGITSTAPTLKIALSQCYEAVRQINFTGGFARTDIGKRFL
jgi:phosphoribosylamine--glycine ligase